MLRARRYARLLVALLVAWLGASALGSPEARADGSQVEGPGFAVRLPLGFRPAGSKDDGDSGERSFRRRVDGGELRLTFSTCTQADGTVARLQMRVGSTLAQVDAATPSEPEAHEVSISGAQLAHETMVSGAEGSERTLLARLNDLVVKVTLQAPASAEADAADAWSAVRGSLSVADPVGGLARVLLTLLGALVVLAVVLRLVRARARVPSAASLDVAFVRASAQMPAPRPAEPFQPDSLPTEVAVLPVVARPGFSRPDDGMPVFTAETKGKGGATLVLTLPDASRRPPPRPVPTVTAAPARTPNLRPPTPSIRH